MKTGKKNLVWLVLILLVFIAYNIFPITNLYTNNAYVTSNFVRIASEVNGRIAQIEVKDNQWVQKGQLLVRLDPNPYLLIAKQKQAELKQAEAVLPLLVNKVQEAEAALASAAENNRVETKNRERYDMLLKQSSLSQEEYDKEVQRQKVDQDLLIKARALLTEAKKALDLQHAKIEGAQANLQLAEYELSQTQLFAPETGYLNHVEVYPGDYVKAGQDLFGLISAASFRIIANYDEHLVGLFHPNQKVLVYLPSTLLRIYVGHIESVGRGVARSSTEQDSALPYIEPSTDWIRYSYRFPVRIRLDTTGRHNILFMGMDAKTLVI